MSLDFLLTGLALGATLAIPFGPIGVLCLRKALRGGHWAGLASGLGTSLADTLYSVMAVLGVTLINDFVMGWIFWLRLAGGLILAILGVRTLLSTPPNAHAAPPIPSSLFRDFVSTFFLTMTNPVTLLSYLAIFTVLDFYDRMETTTHAISLVIGVFLGSSLLWVLLSFAISKFRKKLTPNLMTWLNRIAGVVLLGFAAAAWLSLL